MPQIFNVVRCFQCAVYQVDIDKKSSNKWNCKLCGHKQSLKQIFYQGDSKDCRDKVKELSKFKLQQQTHQETVILDKVLTKYNEDQYDEYEYYDEPESYLQEMPAKLQVSKWAKFLNEEDYQSYINKLNENK